MCPTACFRACPLIRGIASYTSRKPALGHSFCHNPSVISPSCKVHFLKNSDPPCPPQFLNPFLPGSGLSRVIHSGPARAPVLYPHSREAFSTGKEAMPLTCDIPLILPPHKPSHLDFHISLTPLSS